MGNKSHILDFSAKARLTDSKKESRPLPVLVQQALDVCHGSLDQHIQNLFEQADDFLFDMSENGYNNAHFDAMRMLRLKKEGLIKQFQRELNTSFEENLGKTEGADYDDQEQALSFENIALVGDSELEEGIAIDGIVKKAHLENLDELEKIRIRLDTIVTNQSITSENNPFEPAFICGAFKNASLELDIDIESLLVVYKLFERMVVSELSDTYEQVNQFFVDKGVLPDLKIATRKKKSSKSSGASTNKVSPDVSAQESIIDGLMAEQGTELAGGISVESSNQADQVLSLMQGLLAQHRGTQGRPNKSGQEQGVNFQPIDTSQLVSALTDLQATHSLQQFPRQNVVSGLRSSLAAPLQAPSTALESGALGQFNDDMIDIVSMLFDFILDDENVHSEIKALIARLQIPMLKVGLVDRTFFANKKHPARILLNEIARTGISWSPGELDSKRY